MKYLLLILMNFVFFSCKQTGTLDKYKQSLPDSIFINEILSRVIEIDTLNHNYAIIRKIHGIKVVEQLLNVNDSFPIPPPPSDGIFYDELFTLFESKNFSEKRKEDSIFISLQKDTTRKFELSRDIYSKFNKESRNEILFYLPILSWDKRYAYVKYLSGYRVEPNEHVIVLIWTNGKWVKKQSW